MGEGTRWDKAVKTDVSSLKAGHPLDAIEGFWGELLGGDPAKPTDPGKPPDPTDPNGGYMQAIAQGLAAKKRRLAQGPDKTFGGTFLSGPGGDTKAPVLGGRPTLLSGSIK